MAINLGLNTVRRVLEASPSRVLEGVRVDLVELSRGRVALTIDGDTAAERELIEALRAAGSPVRMNDVDPGP